MRLGTGENNNVWQQSWLRKQGHRYVTSPIVPGLENLELSSIVHHQNNAWNLEILNQILSLEDINEIIHTLVPSFKAEDKLIWAEAIDGLYSVKSAYTMIMKNFLQHDDMCVDGGWKMIWDMKIPQRVKLMICRSFAGIIFFPQEATYEEEESNARLLAHYAKSLLTLSLLAQ